MKNKNNIYIVTVLSISDPFLVRLGWRVGDFCRENESLGVHSFQHTDATRSATVYDRFEEAIEAVKLRRPSFKKFEGIEFSILEFNLVTVYPVVDGSVGAPQKGT